MIKQFFCAIFGIDPDDYDSDQASEDWDNQRHIDENDLDDGDIGFTEEEVFEQSRRDQRYQYGSAEDDE